MLLIAAAVMVLVLGLAAYAFAPHPPAVPGQVKNQAELETYLKQLTASGSPPGLSVVVVKDGQVVYNRAFGLSDGPRGVAAQPETVYHWWSMTKIPTALAVLQLYEAGRLKLDDPLTVYLPWFEVKPAADRPQITVRHLLQHTSGLPDVSPEILRWVHYDDAPRDQTALSKQVLARYNTLQFTPGQKAAYSNLNYMLLGALIEALSGQSYETYIVEHILRPLKMEQTAFAYTPSMAKYEALGSLPVVHFYTPLLPTFLDTNVLIRERQGNLLWFNRVYVDVTPSTGLIGPGADVARLMLAYLNQGALEGAEILKAETVQMMNQTAPIDGIGLSWFVRRGPQGLSLQHAGGGPGFASLMRLYPEKGLGLALLANGTELDRDKLADLLAGVNW